MKEIHITDFSGGAIQNADIEDIPLDAQTVLKNYRPQNGKLVRTLGLGLKLDDAVEFGPNTPSSFLTWKEDSLSADPDSGDGFAYIFAGVNSTTKELTVWEWNETDGEWQELSNNHSGVDIPTLKYYAKAGWNPAVQVDHCLRLIPGNVAKPDGTNYAMECWIGRISRVFFDSLYSPTAAIFSYAAAASKPAVSMIVTQLQGGPYNPKGVRIPITNMATGDIAIVGDHTDAIQAGNVFLVGDNSDADNNGFYLATAVSLVDGNTVIAFDPAVKDVDNDTANNGWVELPGAGETRYYRFSYLYDGIQESLMSDPIRVKLDRTTGVFPRFEFTLTRETWNKRITGLNMYRAETRDGIYNKIQTVDFLRKSTEVLGATNGAYTGLSAVYIPELTTYTFVGATNYKIWLKLKSGVWTNILFTGVSGTGNEMFKEATRARYFLGEDIWDAPWRLTDSGGTVLTSGTSGAFAGEQTIITGTDTGEMDAAGGVLIFNHGPDCAVSGNKATTNEAATHSSGERTVFTTGAEGSSVAHGLAAGDLVELYGFTTASGYNGIFKVVGVPSTTTFIVDVKFSSDVNGYWRDAGAERTVLSNYRKAIHVEKGFRTPVYSEGWKLLKSAKGVYRASGTSGATGAVIYYLYDSGQISGVEHPMQAEVSIAVTGQYAVMVSGRLCLADVVLDLGGKDEVHTDWYAYSELYQPDVRPVSNTARLDDSAGGGCTGVANMDDNFVVAKRQSIHLIGMKHFPAEPKRWEKSHTENGLGNLAPRGMICAEGKLYVCHIDGIYRLGLNNLAESDKTPLDRLRVSESIGNVYNAQTELEKSLMIACYNSRLREIMWTFEYTVDGSEIHALWALNVDTMTWREIDTTIDIYAMAPDENGVPLLYNQLGQNVYSPDTADGDVEAEVRFKRIALDDEWPQTVRYIATTYKSSRPQRLQVFTDGNETPALEVDLPAQVTPMPYRVPIRVRARRLDVAITEQYTGFLLVAPVTGAATEHFLIAAREGGVIPNTEIHKVSIYHD